MEHEAIWLLVLAFLIVGFGLIAIAMIGSLVQSVVSYHLVNRKRLKVGHTKNKRRTVYVDYDPVFKDYDVYLYDKRVGVGHNFQRAIVVAQRIMEGD